MGIEIATGKARCSACGEGIPKGASCWHHHVNSRAAPFFCSRCLGRMSRLVDGLSIQRRYEVHEVDGDHMAKRADEDGWLVEVPDLDKAEEAIALAEGIPTENVIRRGRLGCRTDSPIVFDVELPQ